VARSGNYAFVGTGTVLLVVDLFPPSISGTPEVVAEVVLDATVAAIAIAGEHAYIANTYDGLRVIDISTPATPAEVGFVDEDWSALGVAADGHHAYVAATSNGLVVVDVSTPTLPVTVGSYNTWGHSVEVAISPQGTAYLADSSNGLAVIDATIPASPAPIGSYDTPGSAEAVALYGGRTFVADQDAGVEIFRDCDDTIFADNLEASDASAWTAAVP
jgi:hypothetical protein